MWEIEFDVKSFGTKSEMFWKLVEIVRYRSGDSGCVPIFYLTLEQWTFSIRPNKSLYWKDQRVKLQVRCDPTAHNLHWLLNQIKSSNVTKRKESKYLIVVTFITILKLEIFRNLIPAIKWNNQSLCFTFSGVHRRKLWVKSRKMVLLVFP